MVALFKVAVAVISNKQGEFLLTQRHHDRSHGGCWEFPGGKLETGESAEAALRREIMEEVGLEILSFNFLDCIAHQYPDKKVQLYVYRIFDYHGEAKCLENQLALRWASLSDLKALNFPEANQKIISLLDTEPRQAHQILKKIL